MSLLELSGISVRYGEFQALRDLDLRVDEGETLAVVGANGAGKSTLLRTIAGSLRQSEGQLLYAGEDIGRVPDHRRVPLGICLVPEGRRIFSSLTVEENLQVGGYRKRQGYWDLKTVFETFPLLEDRRHRLGTHLSGGEQQATAIGRALMANPRLLLLDEVSLGLAPVVVQDIYRALPRIIGHGTTVLIVEQDLGQAMSVADRVQCLLEGRTALEAPAAGLSREQVTAAYFGLEGV